MTAATYSLTFTGHILQRGFRLGVVMNTVKCRMPLDEAMFEDVRAAFAVEFSRLAEAHAT